MAISRNVCPFLDRFENVTVTAGKLLAPVHGGVGAFPLAAGVTVEDERPLEDRLQHPGQGVMHDTIPERGGADLPGLALVNRERAVGTGRSRLKVVTCLLGANKLMPSR